MSAYTPASNAYPNFPITTPTYGWSIVRSQRWKNLVQRSANDIRTAGGLGAYPVWVWDLAYNVLLGDSVNHEVQNLQGFYNQVHASLSPFNFLYTQDSTATTCLFGTGDGTSTMWQLVRLWGGFYEPVLAPYGPCYVYVNGSEKIAGTDFTISNAGLVTFTVAPANGATLTWAGAFYWICAFTDDLADWENFQYNLWKNKKISIESLKQASLA